MHQAPALPGWARPLLQPRGFPAPHKRSEELKAQLKASLVLLPRPRGTEEPQLLSLHQLGLERENKRVRKPKPAAETPQEEQEPSKGNPLT